jgi:acyl-CoA thioesterase YciA
MKKRITSKICMTKDVGVNGNLFGGNMLAWMDEAAALYAMRMTGNQVVTLRYAESIFKRPVRSGDVIDFFCSNPRPGRTSLTFDISAEVRGEEYFRTECTFVAVDENCVKKAVDWENTLLSDSRG